MKAILPVFEENHKQPYYQQLYHYLKKSIVSGEISENEKLPSLRNLAKSTQLSITTIEQAYNQLLVEGYIYSKPHSGYYVSHVLAQAENPTKQEAVETLLDYPSMDSLMSTDATQLYYDPECFDFNKWKRCMNRVLTDFSPSLHFEGDPQGEKILRMEISRYLYLSRGVSCSPDQIIIGAGTQQITSHLATLLRRLSIEHVALETPGYQPVKNAFSDRGFAITSVQVRENGPAIEKLPANIRTAAYVTPSNNSFTGSVMPIGRRYELLKWANDNDSYIIEDDYDSELRYFGRPIPALKSLENNERVIYLGSFSSTLFAAVKISYMVLPTSMANEFCAIVQDYPQTCSKLEQLALALFMETGYYQTHIKKIRKLYSQKLAKIADEFNHQASDFVKVNNTASGINIILQVCSPKPAEQLKKDAEKIGIPVVISENSIKETTGFDSLILYYNQIPLDDISSVVSELVSSWRS